VKHLVLASILMAACGKPAPVSQFDNRAILYATLLDPKAICYPLTKDPTNWPHTALCSLEQPDKSVIIFKCEAWLVSDPTCHVTGKRAAPAAELPPTK
jgi:hypothetical protein